MRSSATILSAFAAGLVMGALGLPIYSAGAAGCSEQLFKDYLAGWAHNMPKLMTVYADNAVHEDKTVSANLSGKKAIGDFAQAWFNGFPDLSFTIVALNVAGNRGTAEWIANGTHKGDMPGMPASNKVMKVPGVSLFECSDGKVARVVEFWDNATVMKQLGFLPPATH
jgi:steroid delta-isomerase-like uncharacterized protein